MMVKIALIKEDNNKKNNKFIKDSTNLNENQQQFIPDKNNGEGEVGSKKGK